MIYVGQSGPLWLSAIYLPSGDRMQLYGMLRDDGDHALGYYYPVSELRVIGLCGKVKEDFKSVYFGQG